MGPPMNNINVEFRCCSQAGENPTFDDTAGVERQVIFLSETRIMHFFLTW